MHKIVLTLTSSACVCVFFLLVFLRGTKYDNFSVCDCVSSACLCLFLQYFLSEKTDFLAELLLLEENIKFEDFF